MSLIRTKCQCSQCKREDCKKCTNCIMNALSGRRSHTLRCFQTMCRKVSVAEKATKAEGNLPKDWYFYFDERIVNVRLDGLFIFKKDHYSNHFESFDEAAACYPNEFGDMNAETFYKHVGIDYRKAMECIRKPVNPIGNPVENHHNHRSNIKLNRNGLAALGLKRPCGIHFWPSNGNKKQKVNIKTSASNFSPQLECAHASIDHSSKQASVVDDPLLRKGFWAEWVKVNGDIGTVVGQIIKVQLNKTLGCVPVKQYTVRYGNLRDDSIPEIAIIDSDKAWSGCIAFEERKSPENPVLTMIAPFHISWVTPTSYLRLCVDENGTQCLPRVSIQYKAFVLDFTVKQSTVLNAGYGVFLACKAWDLDGGHRLKYFELPAGVMLDFGIYAPIRPEDKKEESEFRLKNFIHKFCCEKYSHAPVSTLDEGNDFVFDITDDFTGKLHEEAQRHVLPFVNEVTSPESAIPNVHAIHDCSGAVHYLLGHERREQGPFRMEVGSEVEIFVDYGDQYENVRIRHGYPRNDHHNILEAQKRLKKDELEFLKEVDSYTSQELRNMTGHFRLALERKNILSKPMNRPNGQSAFATEVYSQDGMGVKVAGRMVLALLLLRKRSNSLQVVEEELDDEQIFLMHETTKEYSRLVKRFIKTFWNNSINDLHLTLMDDEIYVDFMNTFFGGEKDLSLLISST